MKKLTTLLIVLIFAPFLFARSNVNPPQQTSPCENPTVFGRFYYDNAWHSLIPNSVIYLSDPSTGYFESSVPDSNGFYHFCSVPPGNYQLTAQTSLPWGGVNATDAMLLLKYFAHDYDMGWFRFLAGDVNGSQYINCVDALMVSARFAGLINHFQIPDWIISGAQFTVNAGDSLLIDFAGICAGDVDGSYCYLPLPTADAGVDQLNLNGNFASLLGNIPANDQNGHWNIISGQGGNVNWDWSPWSDFTGVPGETYVLTWSVTNPCGIAATDTVVISFIPAPGSPCPGIPTVYYDNYLYHTVLIGNQCWMKENLNAGTMINAASAQTNNGIPEKYCFNNDPANCEIYGGFYRWDEVMNYSTQEGAQGLCPPGWHIATEGDWCAMTHVIDPTVNCANHNNWSGTDISWKMREAGTAHWYLNNSYGNDMYGFSALGTGYVIDPGVFYGLLVDAYWYTSTQYSPTQVYTRSLSEFYGGISSLIYTIGGTMSARCVKN